MRKIKNTGDSDVVTFGHIKTPYTVELMHARFRHHEFAPHSHDTWALCAVISGAKNISVKHGKKSIAQAGDVYLLYPNQPHACGSADDKPFEYVMLYISEKEWQEQCVRRGAPIQHKWMAPVHQPSLCRNLSEFVLGVLAGSGDKFDWSGEWDNLLKFFFEKNYVANRLIPLIEHDDRIRIAYDYLHENWCRSVTLEELSDLCGLSKFEMVRRFCIAYGLPPHRYQMNLRIIEAKDEILRGKSISDVAIETGFSDQSHLGRVFRSIFGIAPGTLKRQIGKNYTENGK